MATEKILNTKVLLRYDTLANWQKTDKVNAGANYVPKKGEACVYEIPTGASIDGVKNPPAIMIKVGDGTKKISALPWTAATAADVYAWAKKSGIEIEEGIGDYITGLSWNSATNKIVVAKASFDNSGNVKFSKTEAGNVKATVSISDVKVDNALHAETANSATEAGKATNDGAGNNIVDTYATKAEIEANENLWTQDTVTKVTDGKQAIKVSTTDTLLEGSDITYIVELKINNSTPGNVTLTQDANGLKANTTPEAIGAKSKQTAVIDKITDKAHVLDSLTQNENGEISYEIRTLTPDDIGAKSKQTTVSKTLTGAQVVGTISQNENGVITITDRTITAADLGLDSAMHFIGVFAIAPTKGPNDRALQNGDVYLNSANNIEYVWADNKWNELGDADSHALKSTGVTADNGLTSTAKLDGTGSIGIADSGVTTAKIKDGDVTKAKLASDVQASLGLADKAVQTVTLEAGTTPQNATSLTGYQLAINGTRLTGDLASVQGVQAHVDTITGELGDKTVKKYVDDAVAGVVAGNVAYAAEAGKAEKDGDGNVITATYKVKQTAVSDPTASGKSLTFIDTISQDAEGVITATKKNVNLDDYALLADLPEVPDIVITETKGALGTGGTIFVSGKLATDTVTGHTISQPMFGLTQQGDIEFVTDQQTIETDVATTKAVSFAIKNGAVTAEKTAAYTTENSDGTHTASTEVWVLYGGSATENI